MKHYELSVTGKQTIIGDSKSNPIQSAGLLPPRALQSVLSDIIHRCFKNFSSSQRTWDQQQIESESLERPSARELRVKKCHEILAWNFVEEKTNFRIRGESEKRKLNVFRPLANNWAMASALPKSDWN